MLFSCATCGAQYPKWTGRCTSCQTWGSISEETETPAQGIKTHGKKSQKTAAAKTSILTFHENKEQARARITSGMHEIDRVLGGGIVPGSVTLLAGEPGIGKSTLVAQLAGNLANEKNPVYYASGEESEQQIGLRCKRLGITGAGIAFSNTVDIASIISASEKMTPKMLIIDSIQTMYTSEAEALPGTPTAVRAATALLITYAKNSNVPVLIIGQVTKDGNVAGPKTLEHLVDTVLTLEGDPESPYRMLRIAKHRFGSTEELGIFEMTEKGLTPVENPSARFLAERLPTPGSVVCASMDGNRPLLIEIQALVEKSFFPQPIRRTSGYDVGRLQMLLAIASKHAGMHLHDKDVYVNVVGGMHIKEHAADLAIIAAVISATKNTPPSNETVYFGEVGLGGEIRSVLGTERRSKEAERHGYTHIISAKTLTHVKNLV